MFPKREKIDLSNSVLLTKEYFKLLSKHPGYAISITLLGFLKRGFNILIFVSSIRILMMIIKPDSLGASLEGVGIQQDAFSNLLDGSIYSPIILLTTLIAFQYLIGKSKVYWTCKYRSILYTKLSKENGSELNKDKLNLFLDKILPGCTALMSSLEICLFYLLFMFILLYINTLIGIFTVFAAILAVAYLVYSTKTEIFKKSELSKLKFEKDLEPHLGNIEVLSNDIFKYSENIQTSAQLVTGFALVAIMLLVTMLDDLNINGFLVIFLVFALRYSMTYALELSRLIGRVLQQRTKLEPITRLVQELVR
jgi:hypothetical protein